MSFCPGFERRPLRFWRCKWHHWIGDYSWCQKINENYLDLEKRPPKCSTDGRRP